MKNITVLMSINKLTQVAECDKLILLNEGKLELFGNPYKLLVENPRMNKTITKKNKFT